MSCKSNKNTEIKCLVNLTKILKVNVKFLTNILKVNV